MREASIEVARWRIWIGRLVVATMLAVLSATFASAQKVSPEEQKLIDYIATHTSEATALLEKTVNIESPTENLTGVKQVGAVFKTEFESIGFTARWIDMPAEMKRAGHLLAEKKGSKGKRVLLLGHIDTVLSGERFRREGAKAFGTGSSDMKAGDVVLYFALKALRETGALKDASIIVMLTGDEEDSGDPSEVSRGDMIAAAKRSDLALSFILSGTGRRFGYDQRCVSEDYLESDDPPSLARTAGGIGDDQLHLRPKTWRRGGRYRCYAHQRSNFNRFRWNFMCGRHGDNLAVAS